MRSSLHSAVRWTPKSWTPKSWAPEGHAPKSFAGSWAVWVLAAALGTASGCKKTESSPPPSARTARPDAARAHVESALVEERQAPKMLTLTGVLDAEERTELAANAVGRVLRTFVELGQRVPAGALIAQLDTRAAALSKAEADANAASAAEQLASARSDCGRNEALLKKGAITKQEYDRGMSQCRLSISSVEAAQARAKSAVQTLSDASIRAPFAGVVADRSVHVGDYVRADTKVITLLVDDPLRLRLSVPEAFIPFAKAGVTVSFETVSVPDRSFEGTIKFVGREVRAQTRDLVVEALVDNHDRALLPGMFVTAHVPTGQALLPVISRRALVPLGEDKTVFVVVDGRLQQRVVQPGAVLGDSIAILDGLHKGERIVTDPAQASDGELVE
jgi:membrane fusion protein (multidrug efflux system)